MNSVKLLIFKRFAGFVMKILKSSDYRAGQMEIEFEEEDFHCYGAKSLTPLRFFIVPQTVSGANGNVCVS